jgi:hypothetical protein
MMLDNQKYTKEDKLVVPGVIIPGFRTAIAATNGVEKNLLFTTWGGLGDQVCSEPTLRFAIDTFKEGATVSLASENPELFKHLNFHRVYDTRKERPEWDNYLVFQTMTTPDSLSWQFISHMITHCVDCPSLNALRCQLPISYKQVKTYSEKPSNSLVLDVAANKSKHVIMHAGRHWESKTFPTDWWDAAYDAVTEAGLTPVWIGKDSGPTLGVVNAKIDGRGVDLRNRTSLNDMIWLCQNSEMVLCSDSSPLHIAATGEAKIAFVATVKHPDYITHWRKGGWGWRMKNFGLGGMWEELDFCPNKKNDLNVERCPESLLRKWLPNPKDMVEWLVKSS